MKSKILLVILVLVTGVVAYLFFTRSNPVLYRHVERASVQYSAFIIQNPFRDREPERRADVVLERLKSRDCRQALSLPAIESARVSYLCEREQKYPLRSWSLMDRKIEDDKLQLIYSIHRDGNGGSSLSPPAWIRLEKINGDWQVISFDTYY